MELIARLIMKVTGEYAGFVEEEEGIKDQTKRTGAGTPDVGEYTSDLKKLIGLTIYLTLVCLRRAVKTSAQFYKAFSKPRFSQNYLAN